VLFRRRDKILAHRLSPAPDRLVEKQDHLLIYPTQYEGMEQCPQHLLHTHPINKLLQGAESTVKPELYSTSHDRTQVSFSAIDLLRLQTSYLAAMPTRNRLTVPILFKQFLASDHL
jgi:hypothetical protein